MLFEIVTGSDFISGALLLLIGAALIPVIKDWMDQAELIKARSKFLSDISEPMWSFQLLALKVSYDHLLHADRKEKVIQEYDANAWVHLAKMRALIGGARWFTSDPTYKHLTDFVDSWLIGELDPELMRLERAGKLADWQKFNSWLYEESRTRTDKLLLTLAEEFELNPKSAYLN